MGENDSIGKHVAPADVVDAIQANDLGAARTLLSEEFIRATETEFNTFVGQVQSEARRKGVQSIYYGVSKGGSTTSLFLDDHTFSADTRLLRFNRGRSTDRTLSDAQLQAAALRVNQLTHGEPSESTNANLYTAAAAVEFSKSLPAGDAKQFLDQVATISSQLSASSDTLPELTFFFDDSNRDGRFEELSGGLVTISTTGKAEDYSFFRQSSVFVEGTPEFRERIKVAGQHIRSATGKDDWIDTGTDEKQIASILRGLDSTEKKALDKWYQQTYRTTLTAELKSEMSGAHLRTALYSLRKTNVGTDDLYVMNKLQAKARVPRLEKEFNIDILEIGETTKSGATTRNPTLNELVVLERALKKSTSSARDEDNYASGGWTGKLTEYFDSDKLVIAYPFDETDDTAAGYYTHKRRWTHAEIVFEPGYGGDEYTALHEIAHNGQYGYWEADNRDSARYKEYLSKVGWVRTESGTQLIETKDSPPRYFALGHEEDSHSTMKAVWRRMDSTGQHWLDAQGKPATTIENAEILSNNEMVAHARVTPATSYIDSPLEHGAELVTALRMGADNRARLMFTSRESYELAVQLDQREIDDEFGVQVTGAPRRIRLETGELALNTAANRARLQNWEAAAIQPR